MRFLFPVAVPAAARSTSLISFFATCTIAHMDKFSRVSDLTVKPC